jgi:tRNA A-37 threonylcarbamoyl transferase component Bud32
VESAPVAEGDIVLDKYRVERVLGQGGMGVVVAATHVDLDQKVALKFLLPSALEHADIVERFAREAKAAAKIQSQHVVRVLDTGRMPSGAPFMVMEYLEGEDLSAMLDEVGVIQPNVAADYLLQACEALGEAHAAGIVHRDLKPSNLFLAKQRDRRSIVKVLDFGISKLVEPGATPLTRTTTSMGSPHYMSPEQLLSSKHVDARSDIWSLGVVLYELIAGSRPFEGETMPEVVGQILNNEPARLSKLRADISLDLELVVTRCLATDVKDRYQSVAELAAALSPFATDEITAVASVERITRVLGGASIPPVAAGSGKVVTIDAPATGSAHADAEAGATVRPPGKKPSTASNAATVMSPAAAATPSPSSAKTKDEVKRAAKDEAKVEAEDGAKDESGPELAHASTTPSGEVSAAVRAAQAGAERPPSRRGFIIAGGVALCLLALVGVRAGMSGPSADPSAAKTAEPPPDLTRSAAPASSAATATATAATAATAAQTQSSPTARPSPGVTPTSHPTTRPTGVAQATATASAARPPATRDSLQMDIK